jgi:hypothetical protein
MTITHKVVLLLLVAAAAPAFATRVMLGEIDAKGETLTCMSTVVKDGNGQDLKVSAVSTLTQKRTNSVQSSVGSQGEAVCLRMKVKCVDGNNKQHCTQSDFDTKATKWAYMLTTTNVCNYYKSYAASAGFVSDVYCCSSNGCNLDKALDSATVMLELPRRAEP